MGEKKTTRVRDLKKVRVAEAKAEEVKGGAKLGYRQRRPRGRAF